jgi:hypothetical protein
MLILELKSLKEFIQKKIASHSEQQNSTKVEEVEFKISLVFFVQFLPEHGV